MNDTPSTSFIPLARLIDAIARSLPLNELLEHILDAACRLIQADGGVIGLYEADTDAMRVAAIRDAPGFTPGDLIHRGRGLGGRVLETGSAYLGRYGDLDHACPEHRDHEAIGVPIRWQERLLGYFGLSLVPPRRFDPSQTELMELFARIAAIGIEHAVRNEEAQRRVQRFELIAGIAAAIHQELELDMLLQRVADVIHDQLQFPNVDIPLIEPDDPNTLIVRIRRGNYKAKIGNDDRVPISRGIMGAAVRERRSQLVNDVCSDSRYVCPPGVKPARAELAVPIFSGNVPMGVINIESDRPFDDLDRRSLEVVADYLAVAINNTRLFQQSREAAVLTERQRLARELHDNVTQILSSISLLSQTIGSAWRRNPDEGEQRAQRLHQLAQTAFAEMRMLLRELAPPESGMNETTSRQSRSFTGLEQLKQNALPGALTKLLAAMVPDTFNLRLDFAGYEPQTIELEQTLYRVCQEAVSNVIRHSGARQIMVQAAVNFTQVVLRVADDGHGIREDFRPGHGLGNMRSRLEAGHGQLRIIANSPNGTLVEARLPRADRTAEPI